MATPKIKYRPDIAGTNELMNGPEMVAVLRTAAENGAKYAAGISPRRSNVYAESFRVETAVKAGPRHDRAEAKLINDSAHAVGVEFVNHGGERILGRTVDWIEQHGTDA